MRKINFSLVAFSLLLLMNQKGLWALEISFEEKNQLPLVNINLVFQGGTLSDPQDQAGLTYFLGESLLRGTIVRNKQQFDNALDQLGSNLNAETRHEALIFRGSVLSSQLDPYLNLLFEMLTQPRFEEAELRKLKLETLSEIQDEQGNDRQLGMRWIRQFLFGKHPYAQAVYGKSRDIQKITGKDLLAHYARLIQSERLLIVGSGNTTAKKIEQWSKQLEAKKLGTNLKIAKKSSPTPETSKITSLEAPKPFQEKVLKWLIIDKPGRTQSQIFIAQVGIKMTHPDYYALSLGNFIFGGPSFASTLFREIRIKKGWSYGANSNFSFGKEARSWSISLFPKTQDTAPAIQKTLSLLKELRDNGVSQEQFNSAKTSLSQNAGFRYNTASKRVENTLLEKTLDLPKNFIQSYAQGIALVTRDQTNLALKRFIDLEHLAGIVVGTASEIERPLLRTLKLPKSAIRVIPYTQEDY